MRVLIYGLPDSGKTYLAENLVKYLGNSVAWFNADQVRQEADDWDFSDEGRLRQNTRMRLLCEEAEATGKVAIADFVAPFANARKEFNADLEIFMDTVTESKYEDTNKVFERPHYASIYNDVYTVTEHNDKDAIHIAWLIGNLFIWNNKAPTTQMLGRYQPWHNGHQALFDRAIAKHGQVILMVRDMDTDKDNPYSADEVIENLKEKLVHYAGKVNLVIVPNVLNITYGRDVGYKIEQESFDKDIEDISATKIRMATEAIEGKYGI
jgi:hypothetical protein|tara:strand:- start:6471 stop:7268 length:798 start_codon:yes stop_codon:yes gene_type:complete